MTKVYGFTFTALAQCAQREARLRASAYPRWIQSKRLTARDAEREIAMMTAISKYLADRARETEELPL